MEVLPRLGLSQVVRSCQILTISGIGYFGLKGVLEKPSIGSPRIPSIAFCVFQLMFAAITYVFLIVILVAAVTAAAALTFILTDVSILTAP